MPYPVPAIPIIKNPCALKTLFYRPWHLEPKVGGASDAVLHVTPTLFTKNKEKQKGGLVI